MNQSEIDESGQRFLIELFEQTRGDQSAHISMFNVGKALGMDKNTSSRTAEVLIGWGMVEVRTLAGAISITADGLEQAKELGASQDQTSPGLGDAPVMDDARCQTVEQIAADLKSQAGNMGLDFNVLVELVADLKTIDAQLISPRPKTGVIRECLKSVADILAEAGKNDSLRQVRELLRFPDK